MLNLLFVYGTLRTRFDNEHARLLRAGAERLGGAWTKGAIYLIRSFPGFVAGEDGTVRGELYRLRDPESTLAILDEYEGEEFERVKVEVNGAPAWIYRIRRLPDGAERIASGDFCPE